MDPSPESPDLRVQPIAQTLQSPRGSRQASRTGPGAPREGRVRSRQGRLAYALRAPRRERSGNLHEIQGLEPVTSPNRKALPSDTLTADDDRRDSGAMWVGNTHIGGNGRRPSVLIADDDSVTRTLLRATLVRWGYAVQIARNGAEAWEQLNSDTPPSLAILDWMMPELDGVDVCRRLRARSGAYVYVLLLTSKSSKRDLASGLEAGADDYITKPFDQDELRARLRVGRRMIQLEEELRLRATRDGLTGLWSRQAILDHLPGEVARAHRGGTAVAVVLADLDHFKRVNDTFGHLAGDAVLHECARRMQAGVRPYDRVGRYGGEEMLLVLPDCDGARAVAICERVRSAVCSTPVPWDDAQIAVSVSVGVTLLSDQAGVTGALDRADRALYQAKAAGRNQVVFAP